MLWSLRVNSQHHCSQWKLCHLLQQGSKFTWSLNPTIRSSPNYLGTQRQWGIKQPMSLWAFLAIRKQMLYVEGDSLPMTGSSKFFPPLLSSLHQSFQDLFLANCSLSGCRPQSCIHICLHAGTYTITIILEPSGRTWAISGKSLFPRYDLLKLPKGLNGTVLLKILYKCLSICFCTFSFWIFANYATAVIQSS